MISAVLRLALFCAISVLLAACEKKADPAEAAKRFFALIANGRSAEAYESTSLAFKAQQSEQKFEQTTRDLGLTEFLSMTSPPAAISGNSATLEAEVSSKDGRKAPLSVTLVDERGAWRIFAVRARRSADTGISANFFGVVGKGAAFSDGLQHPLPPDPELRALVLSTVMLFNDCVKAGSFDAFFDELSSKWQEQLTKGKLQRAFQGFIDKKVDLAHVRDLQPTFTDPPGINAEGLLVVRGYYPASPANLLFSMKFMYEAPRWRLFGLDLSLAKSAEEEAAEKATDGALQARPTQ